MISNEGIITSVECITKMAVVYAVVYSCRVEIEIVNTVLDKASRLLLKGIPLGTLEKMYHFYRRVRVNFFHGVISSVKQRKKKSIFHDNIIYRAVHVLNKCRRNSPLRVDTKRGFNIFEQGRTIFIFILSSVEFTSDRPPECRDSGGVFGAFGTTEKN